MHSSIDSDPFPRKIYQKSEIVTKHIIVCYLLHNLLKATSAVSNIPFDFGYKILEVDAIEEGQWRNKISSPYIQAFQPNRSRHATATCYNMQKMADLFF